MIYLLFSPLQKLFGVLPIIFLVATTITPVITQRIWTSNIFLLPLIISIAYLLFGLWLFNVDFSGIGFRVSLIPLLYVIECIIFNSIFLKIKPADLQRKFPIFVTMVGDGVSFIESWNHKLSENPTSLDKRLSMLLIFISILSVLVLILL